MMISPFRYPGGKTWFIPYVRSWLGTRPDRPKEFVEPFAGGAAVGLTVANEGLAAHVTLVEIDNAVASVWRVIINGEDDVDALAVKIKNFQVTEQSVEAELSRSSQTLTDLAFQTIVRNRSSRGGLLAPGSGLLAKGENGKGLLSCWYPETLCKRIVRLVELRPRITTSSREMGFRRSRS